MRSTLRLVALVVCATLLYVAPVAQAGTVRPRVGFVAVNDTRLEYLDWGGSGPHLILIHGLGDDPHAFGEIAPLLVDRFHVIAYSRRGSGSSDVRGPYDTATATEDLRGLMDALGIRTASLAGASAGGNEITSMAGRYPDRVEHLVYLDAAYDPADPAFLAALKARPPFERPPGVLSSVDAFRAYEHATRYPELDDMQRVEDYLRARLLIKPDGSVTERVSGEVRAALYAAMLAEKPRDYTRVHCAALAIYAQTYYPTQLSDPVLRAQAIAYNENYWAAFQKSSIERVKGELAHVEVIHVPGAHANMIVTSRDQVVEAMRRFLAR